MFPSNNKPIEYIAKAWMGKTEAYRLFPTERTLPIFGDALTLFKKSIPHATFFNVLNVPCRLLDIQLKSEFDRHIRPLEVKLLTMPEYDGQLENHCFVLGSLYLAGEAEIDESLPHDGFTEKHWIHLNQICSIRFTKLYWETSASEVFKKYRSTLVSLDNLTSSPPLTV